MSLRSTQSHETKETTTSFSLVRLNYAVLFVPDLEHSIDFYRSNLSIEMAACEPRVNEALLARHVRATIMIFGSLLGALMNRHMDGDSVPGSGSTVCRGVTRDADRIQRRLGIRGTLAELFPLLGRPSSPLRMLASNVRWRCTRRFTKP